MNKYALRLPDYLRHMLSAIERVADYLTDHDEVSFLQTPMLQDAVIRNIEIIGEAANNVGKAEPRMSQLHPEIPWEEIYAMRNRVAHGYFAVDMHVVWQTASRDLPQLHAELQALLRSLEQSKP
ncbi:MAG: DUF86 domain-containing protein [Burkholderiales bacterium]